MRELAFTVNGFTVNVIVNNITIIDDQAIPSKISRICFAALATEVPGPKIAATPASYRK
jgi:hypothetical protein